MPTENEIIAAAQKQISALECTSDTIDDQIDAIKNAGPDGPLSPQQLNQIGALTATQKQILLGIEKLSLVTLVALDNSGEMADLTTSLATVAKGLHDQASKIANMGNIAQNIGSSANTIAQIATQIETLAKS